MESVVSFSLIKQEILKTDELLNLIADKNNEIKKLKSYCIKMRNSYGSLKLENERLSYNGQTLKSKMSQLEQERDALKASYSRLSGEYRNDVASLHMKYQKMSAELKQSVNEPTVTNGGGSKFIKPNDKDSSDYTISENRCKELKKRLEKERRDHRNEISKLRDKISSLSDLLEAKKSSNINGNLNDSHCSHHTSDDSTTDSFNSYSEIETQKNSKFEDNLIKELNKQLQIKEDDLKTLKSKLSRSEDDWTEKENGFQQKIVDLEASAKQTKDVLGKKTKQLSRFEGLVESLQKENSELKNSLNTLKLQITNLDVDLRKEKKKNNRPLILSDILIPNLEESNLSVTSDDTEISDNFLDEILNEMRFPQLMSPFISSDDHSDMGELPDLESVSHFDDSFDTTLVKENTPASTPNSQLTGDKCIKIVESQLKTLDSFAPHKDIPTIIVTPPTPNIDEPVAHFDDTKQSSVKKSQPTVENLSEDSSDVEITPVVETVINLDSPLTTTTEHITCQNVNSVDDPKNAKEFDCIPYKCQKSSYVHLDGQEKPVLIGFDSDQKEKIDFDEHKQFTSKLIKKRKKKCFSHAVLNSLATLVAKKLHNRKMKHRKRRNEYNKRKLYGLESPCFKNEKLKKTIKTGSDQRKNFAKSKKTTEINQNKLSSIKEGTLEFDIEHPGKSEDDESISKELKKCDPYQLVDSSKAQKRGLLIDEEETVHSQAEKQEIVPREIEKQVQEHPLDYGENCVPQVHDDYQLVAGKNGQKQDITLINQEIVFGQTNKQFQEIDTDTEEKKRNDVKEKEFAVPRNAVLNETSTSVKKLKLPNCISENENICSSISNGINFENNEINIAMDSVATVVNSFSEQTLEKTVDPPGGEKSIENTEKSLSDSGLELKDFTDEHVVSNKTSSMTKVKTPKRRRSTRKSIDLEEKNMVKSTNSCKENEFKSWKEIKLPDSEIQDHKHQCVESANETNLKHKLANLFDDDVKQQTDTCKLTARKLPRRSQGSPSTESIHKYSLRSIKKNDIDTTDSTIIRNDSEYGIIDTENLKENFNNKPQKHSTPRRRNSRKTSKEIKTTEITPIVETSCDMPNIRRRSTRSSVKRYSTEQQTTITDAKQPDPPSVKKRKRNVTKAKIKVSRRSNDCKTSEISTIDDNAVLSPPRCNGTGTDISNECDFSPYRSRRICTEESLSNDLMDLKRNVQDDSTNHFDTTLSSSIINSEQDIPYVDNSVNGFKKPAVCTQSGFDVKEAVEVECEISRLEEAKSKIPTNISAPKVLPENRFGEVNKSLGAACSGKNAKLSFKQFSSEGELAIIQGKKPKIEINSTPLNGNIFLDLLDQMKVTPKRLSKAVENITPSKAVENITPSKTVENITPGCSTVQEAVTPDQAASAVHLEKGVIFTKKKIKVLFQQLTNFSKEEKALDAVCKEFLTQKPFHIARAVLEKLSYDYLEPPDNEYFPAPLLTETQRIMLGFMSRMEKLGETTLFDSYLEMADKFLLGDPTVEQISPVINVYVAICKLRNDINRMRRLCCDAFYFLEKKAVPLFFIVLKSWTRILPQADECAQYPVAKVLVQIILSKDCKIPGYNWMPLRDLLVKHYQYPIQKWNDDEIFKEILISYFKNPVRLSDYAILLFCKNRPSEWVYKKLEEHLKPILNQAVPENFKAAVIILIGNICSQFDEKSQTYVNSVSEWLEDLRDGTTADVLLRSIDLSLDRLPQ